MSIKSYIGSANQGAGKSAATLQFRFAYFDSINFRIITKDHHFTRTRILLTGVTSDL